MDKALHFLISAFFSFGCLALFFSRASSTRVAPWQLSAAEVIRRRQILGGAALGIAMAIILGVWKEWGDSLGLGRLEATDFLADLLGVVLGFVLASAQLRSSVSKRQYHVRLRSPSEAKNPPSHKPVGPQLRSKIRRGGRTAPADSVDDAD